MALAARFDGKRNRPRESDIAAYASHLPQDAGTILIAGTGHGHVVIELIRLGYQVHGLETTPEAFEHARHALRDARLEAPVFRQELDAINLAFRYAGAVIDAGLSQCIGRHALGIALQRIGAHLVEPGIVLLALEVPHDAEHPPGAPVVEIDRVKLDDGSIVTRRRERTVRSDAHRLDVVERYELRTGRAVTQREDARTTIEWYDENEALELVRAAGFDAPRIDALASDGETRRYAVVASLRGAAEP